MHVDFFFLYRKRILRNWRILYNIFLFIWLSIINNCIMSCLMHLLPVIQFIQLATHAINCTFFVLKAVSTSYLQINPHFMLLYIYAHTWMSLIKKWNSINIWLFRFIWMISLTNQQNLSTFVWIEDFRTLLSNTLRIVSIAKYAIRLHICNTIYIFVE